MCKDRRRAAARVATLTAALTLLLCALVAPVWGANTAPVAVTHAWYGRDSDMLPGNARAADSDSIPALLLLLSLTPPPGSYIYAGPAMLTAGKATVLGLTDSGGAPLNGVVLYPRPKEKYDPWSGESAMVYTGTSPLAVPMLFSQVEDAHTPLTAVLSGLLCTETRCTPFRVAHTLPPPHDPAALPPASEQPWWAALGDGIWDSLVAASLPTGSAGSAGIPLAPLPEQEISALSPVPSPDLPDFSPVYFMPELEVSSLGKALGLGFLAGILLNFMPCVLPVLGLKLAGLLAASQGTEEASRRRDLRRYQLCFVAGIMVWFSVLGGILAAADLAWGQLFQSQLLVLALCLLLFLLALNLFGVFSLPILDLGAKGSGPLQAFSAGFTVTLLATPCSGPLLGGVLSWALPQPPLLLLVTLWSVGLGMALPYLIMTVKPGLLLRLPKPGPWMRFLEAGLAFMLLAAVIYLAGLLPPAALPMVLLSLLLTGLAAWLWGQPGGPLAGTTTRLFARAIAGLCIALALYLPFRPAHDARLDFSWTPYTEATFTNQLGQTPLLLEFTADWCPTCKVLEATALRDENLRVWQKKYDFSAIQVDLSQEHPEGQELLRRLGGASLPFLALFPAGEAAHAPLVLRDLVTSGQIAEALEDAFAKAD